MRPRFLADSDAPGDLGEWSAGTESFAMHGSSKRLLSGTDAGCAAATAYENCDYVALLQPPATCPSWQGAVAGGFADLERLALVTATGPSKLRHDPLNGTVAELATDILRPLLRGA